MRGPAQAGLYAAKNDRQTGKCPPCQIGVNQAGPVGPRPGLAAGSVGIVVAFFAKGRVVRQQRIERARTDPGKKAGPPHHQQIVGRFPVGLGHNARTEAVADKPAGQQHVAKRGVVNIGIAIDQQHVQLIPA